MPVQSKLKAVLQAKCPKCWEGDMFEFPINNFRKFSRMYTHCPVCKLRYEVEPGFFIGAMYISYAMSLAIFSIVGVTIYVVFGNPDFYYYVIGIPLVVLLLFPLMYRYSRVVFLHLFGGVKYDNGDRTMI